MTADSAPPEPRRILVIRLSAIGDVVMASPLISSLRRAWPRAHIAWLAEPYAGELLAAHPHLDEFIPWPRRDWEGLWRQRRFVALGRAIRALSRRLREPGFDLVLDTQGLMKSGLLARLSGAPRRIGLGSREGSQRLMTTVIDRHTGSAGIGSEYRELARWLGLPTEPFPMVVAPSPEARSAAGAALLEAGVPGPYAALCPFTTRPQKHWFEDRWKALSRGLESEYALTPILLGGPADREPGARISAAGGAVDLTGRLSLGASAAVLQGAGLVVGVDTGLTHMGIAAGVPTLALFGSTRPYLETGSPRARVLYQPLACSPCRRNPTCDGRFDCMARHTVNGVLAAARDVLEAGR